MSGFVARHKQEWDELAALVARARRREGSLTAAERQRLDELYRRTTVYLAQASTTGAKSLVDYLNALTASAHGVIYLSSREPAVRRLGKFIVDGFPRTVARQWKFHLASALLVAAGGLVGFFAATADPITAHALWPAADARQPGSTPEQLLAVLRHGRDQSGGEKFTFASFLFQHNLKVAVLAMATGVLAAAPTILLMIFNGMLLGVFVAIHYQADIRSELWAWILPHGVTEIGAIILCGGIGLMLGHAVVFPGSSTRTDSLQAAGREAARVCVGAAVMLVLAALIESYVRQSHWSTAARLGFAGGTALFWATYFARGFLKERRAAVTRLASRSTPLATSLRPTSAALTACSAVEVQRID
ncbi:MAG: stage II sporulation protein M [Planctomycetales bacterium]|nr:stage II sporulation protein M [Planctomycetales bacterium]